MNYITHLNNWFSRVQADNRMTPYHMSLYLALFQMWNHHRFINPISVARSELMSLSKIGSANTYSRCIKELDAWGYIEYEPSHNPLLGSKVNMYTFDTSSDTSTDKSTDNTLVRAVRPYINSLKHNKHINNQVNQNKNYDEPL